MRSAGPPTEDDVTVLLDGRRRDSRDVVQALLVEVEAIRQLQAARDGPELDLPRLTDVLNRDNVEYLLVGSIAATAYGADERTRTAWQRERGV
jgi:hypothetical protein